MLLIICFFYYTASTEIYTDSHTLARHDALPICFARTNFGGKRRGRRTDERRQIGISLAERRIIAPQPLATFRLRTWVGEGADVKRERSEEHTSELQSLMRISYADFCLKKKTKRQQQPKTTKNAYNKPKTT